MKSINFDKLIHSATYYLSYQDKIGRKFMIDESSLKYPIADYLTSLEIPISNIKLEYCHPDLKNRRIDLVTKDDKKEKIEIAFEFKISRQETKYDPEKYRVFNDLMRLDLLRKSNKSSNYFLIAGTQSDFIQYFRSIVTERPNETNKDLPAPKGFYTKWFKFKVNEKITFNVKDCPEKEYSQIYKSFIKKYKSAKDSNNLELPTSITTKCVAISAISREFPTPYIGAIWEII